MSLFRLYSNPLVRWWWGMDRPTFFMLAILMVLGGVIITTASISVADNYNVGIYYFAQRQTIFLLLSFFVMVGGSFLQPQTIRVMGFLMFLVFFCAIPLTLFLGADVKGAHRWIEVANYKIQPTEFIKPSLAVLMGALLSSHRSDDIKRGFLVSLGIMIAMGGMILLQPDFGMFLMLGTLWFVQCFMAGVSFIYLLPLCFLGGLSILGAYFGFSHVRSRIDRFIDPSSGDSYQVDQAREALLSGGFFGRGAGEGVVKQDLPDAHTDFIFAVIGEEFGMIACLLLLGLYAAIVFRCYRLLLNNDNRFVQITGCGLVTLFALQTLVNMGVVLSVLPTTGMTLPFISYGGTSTLSMALLMGFVLALTRKTSGYKRAVGGRK